MRRIFLDTNIMMDIACHREGYDSAISVMENSAVHDYVVCASTLSFANLAYLLRSIPYEKRYEILSMLADDIEMLPLEDENVMNAIENPCKDFEDMLQYQCALAGDCDVIITNNKKDFKPFSMLPLFTASEYIAMLED